MKTLPSRLLLIVLSTGYNFIAEYLAGPCRTIYVHRPLAACQLVKVQLGLDAPRCPGNKSSLDGCHCPGGATLHRSKGVGANHHSLTGRLSHMQIQVPIPPHTHKNNLPQSSCQLTCWQRRNMMRVAESRSRSVSGLLQLLHSTYLQHRSATTEYHQ